MRKCIFLLVVTLLNITAYCQLGNNTMEWEANRKLTWSDFKGKTLNWPVAAVTYCGIQMEPLDIDHATGKATYKILTYFVKDSSFYFKEKADSIVLQHEQGHFDIAELYARKMRQALSIKNYVSSKEASAIYQRFYREYLNFQKKYEDKTKHGTNYIEQHRWTVLITSELKKLDNFQRNT